MIVSSLCNVEIYLCYVAASVSSSQKLSTNLKFQRKMVNEPAGSKPHRSEHNNWQNALKLHIRLSHEQGQNIVLLTIYARLCPLSLPCH